MRTSCEFAIETRNECAVYLGSSSEIAATLYVFGHETLSAVDRAFCKDVESLPIAKRLATSSDPQEFADIAQSIGLPLSPRTARRILDGELDEVAPLLSQIVIERDAPAKRVAKRAPRRKVKLQREDAAGFGEEVKQAFCQLAERYYLEADVEPQVRVSPDKITISLPLVEKQ